MGRGTATSTETSDAVSARCLAAQPGPPQLRRMHPSLVLCSIALAAVGCTSRAAPPAPTPTQANEWPAYGRDPGGARFSPLTAIDRANVGTLRPAWTFRTGELDSAFATRREPKLEATPIMIDGTLYL